MKRRTEVPWDELKGVIQQALSARPGQGDNCDACKAIDVMIEFAVREGGIPASAFVGTHGPTFPPAQTESESPVRD